MIIILFMLLSSSCFAEGFGEGGIKESEIELENYNIQQKQQFISFNAQAGYAGFFSAGAKSPVMLISAQLAYIFKKRYHLGLDYHAKLHPERASRSLFQTIGPSFSVDIWRGIFASAYAGLSFAYIENKGYQQSRTGPGWGFGAGYCHMFTKNVGLIAQIAVNQRYLKQLYTSAGLSTGLELRF